MYGIVQKILQSADISHQRFYWLCGIGSRMGIACTMNNIIRVDWEINRFERIIINIMQERLTVILCKSGADLLLCSSSKKNGDVSAALSICIAQNIH